MTLSTDNIEDALKTYLPDRKGTILVTGGNGFIGSHTARRLFQQGYIVRVADKAAGSNFEDKICSHICTGDLCDATFCKQVMHGVVVVLHFAASMGGMGTIHSSNNFPIYTQNHNMTLNVLQAAIECHAKLFFYASSACVYPCSIQNPMVADNRDFRLAEDDVWSVKPPNPQGLYGLEKLNSEMIILQYSSAIDIRIARFHNIYGPKGAWCNGHEKAPAALIRKAAAIKMSEKYDMPMTEMEIWGDGRQRRSFLFIDDCVDAILRLLPSNHAGAINIGSEESVSIQELAEIALRSAGVDAGSITFGYDTTKPVGVAARNSNNDLVHNVLGWTPATSLEDGMKQTASWIFTEMAMMVDRMDQKDRVSTLRNLCHSDVVHLTPKAMTFAILVPITSRNSNPPQLCLDRLSVFARSLIHTTRPGYAERSGAKFEHRVYLAIDEDDEYLLSGLEPNRAEAALNSEGIYAVTTLKCAHPKGHVCALWRDCALQAWNDGCDYFVLLGDDVEILDHEWMVHVHENFARISEKEAVPFGFGCVAFTDVSFPGMPTFPVIHRTHLDIFNGEVVPPVFTNQDGDPYLFQLYRRWGSSSMMSSTIRNNIGGSDQAQYQKEPATDWTFQTLDDATEKVENWLATNAPMAKRKLTLDVVVPSYRVQLHLLDNILQLEPSPTCSVMFIVIIDNPDSQQTKELLRIHGHRPDVRIRVNKQNVGASASRNRGMDESAAEWIHFLDDDIEPNADLLVEAEKIIRTHAQAAGFVGNAQFPPADTVFKTAVHLAGVTYFWDIATKWNFNVKEANFVPWGVTANLVARRNIKDGVKYDLAFPKTGGGEDIDFCIQKHQYAIAHGREGFHTTPKVTVTHPWWNNGIRSYWRFYMWSKGDGALIKMYPQHTYRDVAPSSGELLVGIGAASLVMLPFRLFGFCVGVHPSFALAVSALFLSNVTHDLYRHLWRDKQRTWSINSTLVGVAWFMAICESSVIRIVSETGRVVGMLERAEFQCLRRFDWFLGRAGDGPRSEERRNSFQRMVLFLCVMGIGVKFLH
ncbi:glycosyltransferase family 2 protein [Rickenella mellea]|uniref:Glycosyltransferase family 2 protein n=1 Tax=Rickenella mellea TaxID=50990 RepID=A0A4Y7Q9M3_9AGAM|nr:glycosyltransferase family 2 protein [Rickenella mellea]